MSKEDILESIIALSRRLVSLAQSDEWFEAESLEAERQILIRQYFSTPAAADEAAQRREALQILLDLNQKVMSLLRDRRRILIGDLRSIDEGRAAARAYSGNRK